MSEYKTDVPYGTLDLLILKTLDTMGPMHGYRIARRIEQVAENLLRLNQGSIYPALIRLEQQGWIRTEWGISETKRKVKFYSLTRAGTSNSASKLPTGSGRLLFVLESRHGYLVECTPETSLVM
jgi:PadR family transcriptional regulator, regulatory protein PadR